MNREIINKIELLKTGELFIGIEGKGNPIYQHVYREAAGVYWDEERKGFKSTPLKGWSCSIWTHHIVKTVLLGLGVELRLGSNIAWLNVPDDQKAEIQRNNLVKE